MYPYRIWPSVVLVFFGLSWPVKGHRQERLHLKGSAGVSCRSFEVCVVTLREVMKMEHTIEEVISVLKG